MTREDYRTTDPKAVTLTVPSKRSKCLAVHGVRVASCVKVWASSVDSVVNSKGGLVVDHPLRTTAIHDTAIGANEQKVGYGHESERYAEGVDPEVVLQDRVSEGQVTSNTFFETEHAEYSESLSKSFLMAATLIFGCVVGDRLAIADRR